MLYKGNTCIVNFCLLSPTHSVVEKIYRWHSGALDWVHRGIFCLPGSSQQKWLKFVFCIYSPQFETLIFGFGTYHRRGLDSSLLSIVRKKRVTAYCMQGVPTLSYWNVVFRSHNILGAKGIVRMRETIELKPKNLRRDS